MADALGRALTGFWQLFWRKIRVTCQQILERSGEAHEPGRVDAVGEVGAYGSDRRFVADPEADRVNHIVEILIPVLIEAHRDISDTSVHIASVVEENAADIVAEEGEPRLDIAEQ